MHDQDTLADDLLRGGAAIGAFLGLKPGATFYKLQKGQIPAIKEGNLWVGSKSQLRRHHNSGGSAEPQRQAVPTAENNANTS